MNNGVLIAIGLGAVAAAVVLANKKKTNSNVVVRYNPGDIVNQTPGFNPNASVRYSGQFQPITPPYGSHPPQGGY